MAGKLHYRGYDGAVLYSSEDQLLHGRLLGIRDMVTYEGNDVAGLESNFRSAVDEYLAFCEAVGKVPNTPKITASTVRVGPELRERAALYAREHHRNVGAIVREALESFLDAQTASTTLQERS